MSQATADGAGVAEGESVQLSTKAGALTLPVAITPMPDHVVWVPTNSAGSPVRATLDVDAGAVAQVGPFADDVDNIWGPWTIWGAPERRVSLEAGFRAAMSDPQNLTIARGSGVETPLDGGIEQAVAAARDAEVIVLAIGAVAALGGVDILVLNHGGPPPGTAAARQISIVVLPAWVPPETSTLSPEAIAADRKRAACCTSTASKSCW